MMGVDRGLSESDVTALKAQDDKTLALGWCILNSWKWPPWLPNPEKAARQYTPSTRRHSAMAWIMEKVGHKETMRAWNVEHCKIKTEAEFARWWGSRK